MACLLLVTVVLVHTATYGTKLDHGVDNCAHPLVVLVLCVFGKCRAFFVPAEVFLTWCPHVDFSCAPVFVCLKGP